MEKQTTFIKKDTSMNWKKAKNFIPKENEVIVYVDLEKKKIGNGKDRVNDLPFIDEDFFSVDGTTLILGTEKIEMRE